MALQSAQKWPFGPFLGAPVTSSLRHMGVALCVAVALCQSKVPPKFGRSTVIRSGVTVLQRGPTIAILPANDVISTKLTVLWPLLGVTQKTMVG